MPDDTPHPADGLRELGHRPPPPGQLEGCSVPVDWLVRALCTIVGTVAVASTLVCCSDSRDSNTAGWGGDTEPQESDSESNDTGDDDTSTDGDTDPEDGTSGPDPCDPVSSPQTLSEGLRPAEVQGPSDWCADQPLPVVFLLHGYGASAWLQDLLFRLNTQVEERSFLLVLPDGTVDAAGSRHWNATPACCDFYGAEVDDVGYLTSLLDELESRFTVDPDRVYFTGHSNGGFMSYRMACEIPERIAAIAPLAGSTFQEEGLCAASQPVSVLHIHPTLDATIPYSGTPYYPSAEEATRRWAERNGCSTTSSQAGESLDLINSIAGTETRVTDYRVGCEDGFHASLWTIEGAGHVPVLNDGFSQLLLDWLLDHSR
ncbi:MAG: hypothetical protein CL928_08590 [Deltaproteobacteria bacterium]|nr:hypothetical protein [Deltaproteobacteria bacterium]